MGVPHLGSLHPLCSQGGRVSTCPAQGSDTPAFWGAQYPTCSSLWASSVSSIPKCRSVGWPPRAASGARRVFGSSLGKLFPPKGSMQIVGGSCCLDWGEARPGSLLPSGKPLECEKRHLSCQGGQECKQPLCPVHPAGSQLSTCHAGIATLFPYNRAQSPSSASQAFPGTLVLKLDTWRRQLESFPCFKESENAVLPFRNQMASCTQAEGRNETEIGILAQREKSSCVNTHASIPDVIRQKTQ